MLLLLLQFVMWTSGDSVLGHGKGKHVTPMYFLSDDTSYVTRSVCDFFCIRKTNSPTNKFMETSQLRIQDFSEELRGPEEARETSIGGK